jgi:hypothetical protein
MERGGAAFLESLAKFFPVAKLRAAIRALSTIPIDRAAHMAGLSRRNFYFRYLLSGRVPYVVKTWFHGRKMRRKSFVPRAALLELLARELCQAARLQLLRRRTCQAIPRKATAADLEQLLDQQRSKGGRKSLQLDSLG